jgi:uncharacterized protein (DUF2147 family)
MKLKALIVASSLGLAGLSGSAHAESAAESGALGLWLNQAQGWVVETVRCDSGLCGTLVSFIKGNGDNYVARDSRNPDPTKRGTPLCGLMLLGNFTPSKSVEKKWENGWVYDPDSGATYKGEASLTDANTVNLRGYVLIPLFGKTLTLVRQTGTITRCTVPPGDEKIAAAVNALPVVKVAAVTVTDTRRH